MDKANIMAQECNHIVQWIRDYFEKNGNENTIAVVGISGGIDSSVVAALCTRALGKHRVLGVQLPQGIQSDFDVGEKLIEHLGIQKMVYNIGPVVDAMYLQATLFDTFEDGLNNVVKFNTPARIRMTSLYMIAAQLGGRVANTCNMSETYVGYDTKWGDNAGDFAPIQCFTKTEVRLMAQALGLPEFIINKVPEDGMCEQSDEERFGFTYEELDSYLRYDNNIPLETIQKIKAMHKAALHKIDTVCLPCYYYENSLNRLQEE